jgi:hypothetical protein
VPLQIQGRAKLEGKDLVRDGVGHLALSREGGGTAPVFPLSQFLVGLAPAEVFAVQGPPALEIVEGYTVAVPVQVTRGLKQEGLVVEVTGAVPGSAPQAGQPQPVALTAKPATAAAGAATASFMLTAPARAPIGVMDLLVQGKARVGPADRIVFGPAIPLTVHRPFVLELPAGAMKVVPGQPAKLTGQIKRQPVFKEAIQLRVEGLPAGVTLAAPVAAIPTTAPTFEIPLKVDPKATAASATLKLTATATINGAAYAYPPVSVPIEVAKP